MGDGSSENVRVVFASDAVSVNEGRGGRIVGSSSAGEVGWGSGKGEVWLGVGGGEVRELTDVWESGGVGDGIGGGVAAVREGVVGLSFRVSRRRGEVSKRFGRGGSGSDFG